MERLIPRYLYVLLRRRHYGGREMKDGRHFAMIKGASEYILEISSTYLDFQTN